MREANQSTLTLISDADGWKGCEAASMMLAGGWDVELIIPLTVLYDAVWRAICCITASIWEDVSGDSFWYDSTKKAVSTAENKPACIE